MAIDKRHTSPGVKILIWILIVAFVFSGIGLGATSLVSLFQGSGTAGTATGDPVSQVKQSYEPGITALKAVVASDPESYTPLVNLGNLYLDYASQLSQAAGSQPTTSVLQQQTDLYTSAKDVYAKALVIRSDDPGVRGDYAIALFSTGETAKALEVAGQTVVKYPDAALVWLKLGDFNLILHQQNPSAPAAAQYRKDGIAAYQRYLKLEPKGQYVKQARDSISQLQGAAAPQGGSGGGNSGGGINLQPTQ